MFYLHQLLNPITIVETIGLVGVWLIVFAESGLFFGFFLPGDSLLFTAGFLASQNFFLMHMFPNFSLVPALLLFAGSFVAAVAGDNVGFMFGRRVGPGIFSKDDSLFFHKKYPLEAQKFYEKHGKKTIILARFIPVVRTFAPIVAGVGSMKYRIFFSYNLIGGFVWTGLLIFLGYFLGRSLPNAESYITPLVILIIIISFVPGVYHLIKERRSDKTRKNSLKM